MKHKSIKNLILTATFIAMAIVLPFLTGQIPEMGNMLLPMHIPVMLCGLICGARYGLLAGLCAPLMRSLIFGKPVFFPTAIAMAPELAIYGLVIGLIFERSKRRSLLSLYCALLSSMIAGRIAWGFTTALIMGFKGFTSQAFISGAVLNAIPGIILQLIIIPSLMLVLRRAHLIPQTEKIVLSTEPPHLPHDLLTEIYEHTERGERVILAIDGRCGAGKSTLASALADKLGASLFHTDDFHLPRSMRSEKRLAEPGGNLHRERFLSEVLIPLSEGRDVKYRKYNCKNGKLSRPIAVKSNQISIIEGSYSLHPELRPYYTLTVFCDVPEDLRRARLEKREGERVGDFYEKWIPLEEKYIAELGVIEFCDKIITAKE